MNVLVTGSNGQLGSELRVVASQSEHTYIFTDVDELDITNAEAVDNFFDDEKIDVVVNCAAYTNVDKAEDDEALAFKINCEAVRNLAVACRQVGAVLLHISTDYVFDGSQNIPYTEMQSTSPQGVYAKTKLAGEEAVVAVGCNSIILRTSWLYSAFGNNFVKTMQRLTAERETLNVVFDQVGTPTYAADLATLIFSIIENNQLDNVGIYHYANEGVCSWYDFAVAIAQLFGNECQIKPCHSSEYPSRVVRPHFSVLDKTKVKQTFGVDIPHWAESLKRCVDRLQ